MNGLLTFNEDMIEGKGNFYSLTTDINFHICRNPDKPTKANHPTHIITGFTPKGREFKIGVAWEHKIKKEGDFQGRPMFSISIQDPSFPDGKLEFSAFPKVKENKTLYRLAHKRPPRKAEPQDNQSEEDSSNPTASKNSEEQPPLSQKEEHDNIYVPF